MPLDVLLLAYGAFIVKMVTLVAGVAIFAITPWGRQLRGRLKQPSPDRTLQQDMLEELHRLRSEMSEVQERLDFAERLLSAPKGESDPTEQTQQGPGGNDAPR